MPHWPVQPLLVVFLCSALVTLVMGVAVLRWHESLRRREARDDTAGNAVAVAFARFLAGQIDRDRLRARVQEVPPRALWMAIESFAESIEGDDWRRLTAELRDLPEITRARKRLARGTAWQRAFAARRIGLLQDPTQRGALVRAMEAGPPLVALSAALALARLHDAAALEWLIQHPEALAGLGRHQMVALIKRFGPSALDPLRRALALEPSEATARLAVIDALGLWKDEASRSRLETLLGSGELETRVAAARALGHLAAPASIEPLDAALRDRAWQVRAQAARALGSIGWCAAPAAPGLAARLRDLSWWVRRNAAYSLGRMGIVGEHALGSVAEGDRDPYARDASREVLQMMDWERENPGGQTRVE
jgi:HEAT repeat protein